MAAEFVAKLRELDAKNSQKELSIEKFLTKSEEAFFDKVKEDKRTSASSLRSQRDSYYHTNASRTSFYSTRPDCEYPNLLVVIRLAHVFVPAPSFGDEMGMVGNGGDPGGATLVIPSRLQVFLSRELFGWPLYGLILAFGQVRWLFGCVFWVVTTDRFADVERDQLSNRLALWFERTEGHRIVHPRLSLLRCFGCLVPALPSQAFGLGPFRSLVLLRRCLPPHRASLRHQQLKTLA